MIEQGLRDKLGGFSTVLEIPAGGRKILVGMLESVAEEDVRIKAKFNGSNGIELERMWKDVVVKKADQFAVAIDQTYISGVTNGNNELTMRYRNLVFKALWTANSARILEAKKILEELDN